MQVEWKWCYTFNGATSSISFTRLTTFRRKNHSPPYNILCASPQGIHPNVTFPQDSQVGIPKLRLLLSQNFGCSYLSQIKFFFVENMKIISYIPQKDLSKGVQHTPIEAHLSLVFNGFMVRNQFLNLNPTPSFDHDSYK